MHTTYQLTFINNSAAIAGDTIYGGTSIYFRESWANEHYSQLLLQCTGINPTASLSELCGVVILDIQNNSLCSTFHYTAKVTTYAFGAALEFNVVENNYYYFGPIDANLTILPCPLGLILDFTSGDWCL